MDSFVITEYVKRPRIDRIFDIATKYSLVYVIAGAGYGKTQAVRQYVDHQKDAVVRWIQLTDSDNIGSNYWEHLTRNISLDNPMLATQLREFGFPDNPTRFKRFAQIVNNTKPRASRTFIVLDDFHLIHSKQALAFAEWSTYLQIPGSCIIIISRNEPQINTMSIFAKGNARVVTEDELRFTEDEIAAFLTLRDIPFTTNNLAKLWNATEGWALAIRLLLLVLKRIPDNPDFALDTMKQNIYKLFETEAFNNFSDEVQRTVVKIALLSDLPITPLHILSSDSLFTQTTQQLSSFLWYDSRIGDYRIHPLYLEFLSSKVDLLSEEEKLDTYRRAAEWCFDNNFYIDSVHYLAKSKQYKYIVERLFSYPFKLPYDTCEYFFNIIEELDPEKEDLNDFSLLVLKNFFIPLLLMGMGRYEEAKERSLESIRKWEKSDSPFSINILYSSYSNLAYIDMYMCTYTHEYKSPEYLSKSVEYYKKSIIPPEKMSGSFSVADVRAFACLVGEGAKLNEFDIFLDAARKTAHYVAETYHDMYYGYEDLVVCEIALFKNRLDEAKKYANEAILKANEKNQYAIEAMAQHYLLRIALQEGDFLLVKQTIAQLSDHLDNEVFWSRQLLYDLIIGYFYASIGIPILAPSWMIYDEHDATAEIHSPVAELIVSVKIYIALKKYNHALTVLYNSYPREPQNRFYFGELMLLLLTAVAKNKTGDTTGAIADFEKAYEVSFNGMFEMPFVELGKELRSLCNAVIKQNNKVIPVEWLKKISRKGSIYTKKAAVILSAYKREKNIEDIVVLSERELEVLYDLSHGLSRDEISTNRYLSINTVHKIIQSIFFKLEASNSVDAIRIAIEKNILN